eukprot:GHVU01186028.1.p1 GENE.GHVU01186028.1~~GHVU01186028.1.p1  ORF type:complete len:547 (+),score=146.48 GHVU01186028.1:159-1799(+)
MEALLCGLVLLAAAVALLARQLKFVGKDEQLFVEDLTELRAINGPATVFLPLLHKASRKAKALALGPLEYQVVTNSFDGSKRVEVGPQLLFLRPYDELEGDKQLAISLKATEFVRLLDAQTGAVRVEVGEQGKVVPGPYEAYLDSCGKRSAISLKCHEYVRIEDKMTGKTRVEQGEQLVFLTGHEEFVGAGKSHQVQQAVEIDEETAVLTRNKRDGQQALVTSKQVFVPRSDQEIIEVRKLIKLANHEACIVRGKDGTDQYFFGKNADQRAFFLPPYSELVELKWSRGRRRERRDLVLKKIDLRPMFMSFEFNCRTADNVELILEGTFFWEVVDLQAMFKTTCDTTGDVCNHARSKFIERVSKVTLQEFMRDFNKIAEMVHKEDDSFYSARGVLIHSLEVSGYRCAESSTALILEQIIQETTNRMNRLQQQESENEWQLLQIKGDIEEERAKKELLEVQIENSNARSSMEGLAEAQKVKSFLLGLADDVPDVERRIALWNVLRKKDALQEVCKNGARLYYTPNDVNLSIEDRTGPCVSETSSACKI